jgi:hypothetical protein
MAVSSSGGTVDADKLRGRALDGVDGPQTERLAILPAVPGNFSFVGSHAFAERWAALPAQCARMIRRGAEDELGGI